MMILMDKIKKDRDAKISTESGTRAAPFRC